MSEKKGCGKIFRRKKGWVGRPLNSYCGIAGALCFDCENLVGEDIKEIKKTIRGIK